LRRGDHVERIIVPKFDSSRTISGVNTFDPTQPKEPKMRQFESVFGHDWR
jgi:hypothetical protein